MKSHWKVPDNRPLADFAPTIILKAKDFATEITIFNHSCPKQVLRIPSWTASRISRQASARVPERETAFGCRIWRLMTTMAVVADSDGYFGQHLFGVGAALLTRRSQNANPLINLRFKFVRGAF
jgi:hypothetical protein